ncbi:hypothetical protein B0J18DRAFT_119501 [Chaetomium sp. MPI-SDFR-AT-0129]|nr:hypothetical protein B0J18DRAFT_119501 [Chaetomium sp. MPI-SDFR-AT-0129]
MAESVSRLDSTSYAAATQDPCSAFQISVNGISITKARYPSSQLHPNTVASSCAAHAPLTQAHTPSLPSPDGPSTSKAPLASAVPPPPGKEGSAYARSLVTFLALAGASPDARIHLPSFVFSFRSPPVLSEGLAWLFLVLIFCARWVGGRIMDGRRYGVWPRPVTLWVKYGRVYFEAWTWGGG